MSTLSMDLKGPWLPPSTTFRNKSPLCSSVFSLQSSAPAPVPVQVQVRAVGSLSNNPCLLLLGTSLGSC